MRKSFAIIYIAAAVILGAALGRGVANAQTPASSAPRDVTVEAKLDSADLIMGRTTTLRLSVSQPKGRKVMLPLLRDAYQQPYISLLNDSVEIRPDFTVDTVDAGSGRIRVDYRLTVQAFDSGRYVLPKFIFVDAKGEYPSNEVTLNVIPVKVGADDPIADYTGVADPLDAPGLGTDIWNFLKAWWWLILLMIAAGATAWWAWKRYRATGTIIPRKPETPPYEEAVAQMRKLSERKLWENGREKDYYTILTKILRHYMMRAFGIQAMEMTTKEIMTALREADDLRPLREYMRPILDMADFAKYAKVRPLAQDNEASFDNARQFLNSAHEIHAARMAKAEAEKQKQKGNASRKQGSKKKKK